MDADCTSKKIAFQGCGTRKVTGRLDGGTITSDAGALLFRELEERFGLIEKLAEWFEDYRDPGYYGHHCYLPLYAFSGESLLASLLRFSGQDASADALRPLRMIVDHIQTRWPEAQIIVRADSGFVRNRIMRWCEDWDVDDVSVLAQNDRLERALAHQMQRAKDKSEEI